MSEILTRDEYDEIVNNLDIPADNYVRTTIDALHDALVLCERARYGLTQGSTIRAYGIKVYEGAAEYTDSIVLTEAQRAAQKAADEAITKLKEKGWMDEEA